MCQYKCYKCENISSIYVKDIIRHWNCKKKCEKTENSLSYSEDQIIILSLFPENFINNKDIEKFEKSCVLYDNKDKVFDLIIGINVKKEKTCNLCNKKFNKKIDIKRHILFECFGESLNKNSIRNKSIYIESAINTSIDNSINNITNNITNNNNYNINIEVKCPLPFSNDWDRSHINFNELNSILFSNHLISLYLTEILKNDNNLNVILNNNDTEGLVYNESKYIKMKKEDITDKTMDKINNDLNNFLNENKRKKEVVSDFLLNIKNILEKKIVDFKEDKNGIKQVVVNFISQIYETKRESAIEACNKNSLSIPIDGF